MKKQPSRQEMSVGLLRQAALEAWHRRDYAGHFKLLHQADELSPNDPALLLNLGTAHGLRTEFAEAVSLFERAVAHSRDKSRILSIIGQRCRDFLRFDLSSAYLERAAQESGSSADTLATLAEMKERLRETEEANVVVERALKIDSKCQSALLVRARLRRVSGALDEAEKIVRSILSRTDRAGLSVRIRGWYELASILDRQARYDEAVAALVTVKRMTAQNAAPAIYARLVVHKELRQAAAALSAEHFQRWRDFDPDPTARRIALIAGHPRSGTTLLEQLIDAHSEVISAEETPIFFETYYEMAGDPSRAMVPLLDSLSIDQVRNARESYLRRMDLFVSVPARDHVLVDKNPALTGLIPGLLRIIPQIRIIIALRDPRDVCLSCFMQYLDARYLTLEATVDEYCSLMGFWLAIKPHLQTPALEVRYEDVVTNVEAEAKKTLTFLDLDWEPAVLNFNEHARKKLIRSPTYAEVARPISQGAVGRWKHYRKHLEPYLTRLAPLVEAFGYEAD